MIYLIINATVPFFIINHLFHREFHQTFLQNKKTWSKLILKSCLSTERAGIRTPDNLIKSQVLYHLSYTPLTGVAGLEPAVQESESCALPLGDTPSA